MIQSNSLDTGKAWFLFASILIAFWSYFLRPVKIVYVQEINPEMEWVIFQDGAMYGNCVCLSDTSRSLKSGVSKEAVSICLGSFEDYRKRFASRK